MAWMDLFLLVLDGISVLGAKVLSVFDEHLIDNLRCSDAIPSYIKVHM
jgi:hypothetical protein